MYHFKDWSSFQNVIIHLFRFVYCLELTNKCYWITSSKTMYLNKSFTRENSSCLPVHDLYVLSCVRLFETPWTVDCQAPLSMGFSRQECWSGLQFPTPGDLLRSGIEPLSLSSLTLAGRFFTTEPSGKPWYMTYYLLNSDSFLWISILGILT